MLEVIRRYREMRLASVLVIVAALLVGGYNVHRALGVGSHVEQASLAAEKLPSSGNSSRAQFGDPVFTKADASTLKSVEKLTRIEELQVGERIRSDAPTDEFDLQFGTEIIRSDWRKVTLVAPKRDGSSADVVLLRPLPWLTEQQAEVGGTVFISVPECGIDGHANVLAIEPCPPIEPAGDLGGRVITGTFRHQVSASISLSIAGQAEPILCTGNHPFWSEDRHNFVRADSLQPNETLRTTTGTTTVTSLSHIPGSTPVYNLEIHGTHVYHVGTSGVLVHNGDPCPIDAAFGLRNNLDEFADRIAAETGRAVDRGPFFLKLADDADLASVLRQAMENSGRNHVNFQGFEFAQFQKWLREGGPKSYPANGNVTNWEIYTLLSEYLHKTTFYGGKGSDFIPWPL